LENNTFAPQIDTIMVEAVFKLMRGGTTDVEVLKKARESIAPTLKVFNDQLGKVDYIAGDFSLVDIFQAPNFQHLQKTEVGKEIFASYPNIGAWWKRLSARPGWQSVMEDVAKA
jgi:glutathione S-transferase